MTDLLLVRCALALRVEELLLATAKAAIIVIFTLVLLVQALKAHVAILAAL